MAFARSVRSIRFLAVSDSDDLIRRLARWLADVASEPRLSTPPDSAPTVPPDGTGEDKHDDMEPTDDEPDRRRS